MQIVKIKAGASQRWRKLCTRHSELKKTTFLRDVDSDDKDGDDGGDDDDIVELKCHLAFKFALAQV